MSTTQTAARRAVRRELTERRVKETVRLAHAAGHQIVRGRPVELKMKTLAQKFDASNPPSPDAAKQVLEQVAELLGVDPDMPEDLRRAFESLLEAAGVDGGAAGDDPADPSDADGSEGDGAEGVAPPRKAKAIDPKVVGNRLTPEQMRICKQAGITPAQFLATKRAFNRPLPKTLGAQR